MPETTPNTKPGQPAPSNATAPVTGAAAIFEKTLQTFIRTTKQSQIAARTCAEMGLEHFADHGNTIWLQRFLDAMPANYSRKQAFLKWAAAFSPLAMVKGKLVKDTSENASAFDLPEAKKKAFWDFAPETPILDFTSEDLTKALVNLVKRYQGKRYNAADEAALKLLAKIEGAVTMITGEPIPHDNDEAQAPVAEASEASAA